MNTQLIPTKCPSCESELILSETGVDLYCPNFEHCPEQVMGRLSYYTQRNLANIQGLSEKQIQKFIKEFGMRDVYDLYNLPFDKILELEGFKEKSIENLQKSIENSKQIPAYKFLAGLGIEGIGPENAKLIIDLLV